MIEKRDKRTRRLIYFLLRALGMPPSWAYRVRDWSGNHIIQIVRAKYHVNSKARKSIMESQEKKSWQTEDNKPRAKTCNNV
jgi:hypothetical protein